MSTVIDGITAHDRLVRKVNALSLELDLIGEVPLMLEEISGFRCIPEMAQTDDLQKVYESLNQRALDELGPMCGNCGDRTTFSSKSDWTMDHETGYIQGEYLVCDKCGAETDEREVARWQEAK